MCKFEEWFHGFNIRRFPMLFKDNKGGVHLYRHCLVYSKSTARVSFFQIKPKPFYCKETSYFIDNKKAQCIFSLSQEAFLALIKKSLQKEGGQYTHIKRKVINVSQN